MTILKNVLKWVFIGLLIALVVATAGIGWYFSNTILTPRAYSLIPELTVLAVSEGAVTLPLPTSSSQFADTRKQGVYGLLWDTGSGRLGEITEEGTDRLTRRLELLEGELPEPGAPARLDYHVYRSNPLSAHGLAFEEVTLEGEVGKLKAWWLESCAASSVKALRTFAAGIQQDYEAVRSALELPWSNAQTEGQVTRLKFIKRQMYGRANFDLLRQRVLLAA